MYIHVKKAVVGIFVFFAITVSLVLVAWKCSCDDKDMLIFGAVISGLVTLLSFAAAVGQSCNTHVCGVGCT